MKLKLVIVGLFFTGSVFAHGPTPQKTDEFVGVDLAPEVLWKKITQPCAIAKWSAEVTACNVVNDKQESLTLSNGGKILQEIDEKSEKEMTIYYRLSGDIDIKALPISSLTGKIQVEPANTGSKVTWSARYYRAFTGNEPPAGQDDESAKNAMDTFVKASLNGLKEGKSAKKK